jgi:hypothetical protein
LAGLENVIGNLGTQPEPMTAAFRARLGLTALDLTSGHSPPSAFDLGVVYSRTVWMRHVAKVDPVTRMSLPRTTVWNVWLAVGLTGRHTSLSRAAAT